MGQTQAISGIGGKITVSSSVIIEVKEWSGTINVETADVTPLSASGWRARIPTITDFTGTFTTNVFMQRTVGKSRAAVFNVGSTNTTSKPQITTRIIHSTGISVPKEEVEFSMDFESDGPIAVATS
jgi:hypothetical protein